MKINELIEESIQDLLQARAYIIAQSIAVARHADRLTDKGSVFVQIESDVPERLSNNHNLYTVQLNLQTVGKIQDDMVATGTDALAADVAEFANYDLTVAGLNAAITAIDAASGIAIAGYDYMPGDSQNVEQYEFREQIINIALTYTP